MGKSKHMKICCPWNHGLQQKTKTMTTFPEISSHSHLSANDKGNNKMIPKECMEIGRYRGMSISRL